MRVRPESVTHLVVKLFNVKSKFDYIDKNKQKSEIEDCKQRQAWEAKLSNDAGHLQAFCRFQVTEKLLRTSGLMRRSLNRT
jgi:hypothetical protein